MRQRLIVIGKVDTFGVGVSKRANHVELQLRIEVRSNVYVFYAQLHTPFVSPPPVAFKKVLNVKLVKQKLSVKLQVVNGVYFKIAAYHYVVGATQGMFHRTVENDRVQVLQFEVTAAAHNYRLEQT